MRRSHHQLNGLGLGVGLLQLANRKTRHRITQLDFNEMGWLPFVVGQHKVDFLATGGLEVVKRDGRAFAVAHELGVFQQVAGDQIFQAGAGGAGIRLGVLQVGPVF